MESLCYLLVLLQTSAKSLSDLSTPLYRLDENFSEITIYLDNIILIPLPFWHL